MAMSRSITLLLHAAAVAASPTVVVTGATGRTGYLVYKQLKEQGVAVRAFVRNATKARMLLNCTKCDASEGIFVGDTTDKASLTAAMTGANALAIATSASPQCKDFRDPSSCTYPKGQFPVDVDFNGGKLQIETFATANGGNLGPVVLCSSMGSTNPDNFLDKLGNGHVLFYKLNLEAYLMSCGVPFTVVKPCGLIDADAEQRELVVGHDDSMHLTPPSIPRAPVVFPCRASSCPCKSVGQICVHMMPCDTRLYSFLKATLICHKEQKGPRESERRTIPQKNSQVENGRFSDIDRALPSLLTSGTSGKAAALESRIEIVQKRRDCKRQRVLLPTRISRDARASLSPPARRGPSEMKTISQSSTGKCNCCVVKYFSSSQAQSGRVRPAPPPLDI